MRILGIDPGYATLGYGLVDMKGNQFHPVVFGAITTSPDWTMPERLKHIYTELMSLITEHRPDTAAIEELFFNTNVTTAMYVAQARGVAILAGIHGGLSVDEYTPAQVKQALVGYGKAEKRQMQLMVKTILHLPEIPRPDDAADALAIAICHGHSQGGVRRIQEQLNR